MNLTILNRQMKHPADGWYPIEAKGFFPGIAEDGRKIVQVIDDKAITSIVNRFNSKATAGSLPHGSEMLIDREHFRHHTDAAGQKDKESIAYGWIKQLRVAPDGSGLQMQNRWTGVGQQAVDTGEYRFVSTEYIEAKAGDVWEPVNPAEVPVAVRNKFPAAAGWEYMRPLELTGLSLTNDNNNKGTKPLTVLNKTTFADVSASAANQQPKNKETKTMKSIAQKLGLAAEASEEAILAEVTKIQNRVTELEPLAADNLRLKNHVTEMETAQQDTEIAGLLAARKITETKVLNRLKPVLAGMKTTEERTAFLDDCGFKAEAATATPAAPARVLNRSAVQPPPAAAPSADQGELATKIKNRANELQASGMKFERAWNQATSELAARK